MLADQVDVVIGVDTHRDTHAAAIGRRPTGAVLAPSSTVAADALGYRRLLRFGARARPRPAGLGDRGHRQLRRRA